jgi:hypothetical protein
MLPVSSFYAMCMSALIALQALALADNREMQVSGACKRHAAGMQTGSG